MMIKRRRLGRCNSLLVLVVWMLTLPSQADIRVVDDRGRALVLSGPAYRIVSLLPSLTESVCVLGGCDRLVGVDRYSNWPNTIRSLPRMGGGIDPNIEAIVAARPDVVLLAGSTRGSDRLEALGLMVVRLEPRTLSDVQRVFRTVADLLDVPPFESTRIWQDIETEWKRAARLVPTSMQGKRVYFEVSPIPYGAGPTSFIGETLQHLGLVNIVPPDTGPFPKINPEFVVRAQPDIIMLGDSSRSTLMQRPGWKALQAVKQDQLCVLDQKAADVVMRAGPRLAEAAHVIAACLQRLAKVAP
jgi:iron complex transport system substrate-binding protein